MTTQVLIVHGQLPFAIKLKQTLERSASFEAHPFTSVEAAVEYLTDHVQDVAVVDFAMTDYTGEQIIQELRGVQPNIAVIAAPKQNAAKTSALGIAASLDAGFSAQDLVKTINDYFERNERPSLEPPGTTALLSRLGKGQGQRPAPSASDILPEYSSLDDVLANAGGTNLFEAPIAEGDTPANMPEELDWMEESSSKRESSFDDVLSALPPDAPEAAAPSSPFDDLVNSMRTEEAHRPLPSRQQQLVEFILSGGTDSLENEPPKPERPQTASLSREEIEAAMALDPKPKPQPEPEPPEPEPEPEAPRSPLLSAFDRLSKEEPTPPEFEESGTVSDLVEGVQDRSFRNVLSILGGDEGGEGVPADDIAPSMPGDFDVGPRRKSDASRSTEAPEVYAFEDVESTPARIILQRTLENTMSGGTFSLEELLAHIDDQLPLHRPKVQPLPSWTRNRDEARDDAYMVREPEFLPEEMPDESTPAEASEDLYADQTTIASHGQQIEAHPEMLETEWIEHEPAAADETIFPDTLPEEIPADATVPHQATVDDEAMWDAVFGEVSPDLEGDAAWDEEVPADATPQHGVPVTDDAAAWGHEDFVREMPAVDAGAAEEAGDLWYDLPEQDFNTQFEMMAAFEVHGEAGFASGALYTETSAEAPVEAPPPEPEPEPASAEDEHVAQLALSLTAASLEMTAEAALLARDGQIVAYTGRMPGGEIEELRDTIADDWDAAPGEARIRFITAPGSGKDYMLYSRRTEADFTLSLIFAGTTPLRDIRRQGKRLVDALVSVPEAPAAPAPTPAPVTTEPGDAATRTPYACVWLLRDPAAHLDPAASQAVTAGLNVQMREQGWTIRSLQVHEDYVYLLADVPGEEPAYKLVRDLKHRSAALAHAQNPAYTDNGLWADGYLVVMPGRDLDIEEIQQFINFERME